MDLKIKSNIIRRYYRVNIHTHRPGSEGFSKKRANPNSGTVKDTTLLRSLRYRSDASSNKLHII